MLAVLVASENFTMLVAFKDKPQQSFPDVPIGIDIGTLKCSVAVWNGHQVKLLKNTHNQNAMMSYVMFKNDILSVGVT
jgi:heat shock 70kDa protein 4